MNNNYNINTKSIAYIGILSSMVLVLSYFERMLPPPVPIPGVKLGLSNIIILIGIYLFNTRDAFFLLLVKIVLIGALFSGLSGMFFGFCGGLLSFLFMLVFKKTSKFSEVGVSVIGAVTFNVGQIFASIILIDNILLIHYLPVLMFFGLISGFITGVITHYLLFYLRKSNVVLKYNGWYIKTLAMCISLKFVGECVWKKLF